MSHGLRHPSFHVNHLAPRPTPSVSAMYMALSAATAQLKLERQRHEAFVSTLAHELRQPLSALANASEVLRAGRGQAADPGVADIIWRQTRNMSRLIEDVLEAVRLARGMATLRKRPVDVAQLVGEVVSDVTAAVSARGHALDVSVSESLWVDGDPDRLRQVLSNLFDNAIKFTEPGGRISCTASRAGSEAVVTVSDTGRGFEPRELTQIFELYSQVRPGDGRGLGIGLSIAHEIVVMHKGHLEVRSDGPSRGSEFVVTLPVIDSVGVPCNETLTGTALH